MPFEKVEFALQMCPLLPRVWGEGAQLWLLCTELEWPPILHLSSGQNEFGKEHKWVPAHPSGYAL